MINAASVYNHPDIEQILDTVVTKDNKRYYKVKWVKITWEEETDLAYFSNVVNQFWREYIPENIPLNTVDVSTGLPSDISSSNIPQDEVQPNSNVACSQTEAILSNPLATTDDLCTLTAVVEYSSTIAKKAEKSLSPDQADRNIELDVNKHEEVKLYSCTSCNKQFKKKSTLVKHESTHYDKRCSLCGKECSRISHLRTHMLTHSCIRPWSCDQCEMSFVDRSTLIKHKLKHTNERNYECTVCNKKFQRAEHLRRHRDAKHDKIKKFQCDVCNKKFHQKSSLKVHLNTHTGEKPYLCNICLKAFADNSTLAKHIRIHNKNNDFKCMHCQKVLSSKHTLDRHISNIHSPAIVDPPQNSTVAETVTEGTNGSVVDTIAETTE